MALTNWSDMQSDIALQVVVFLVTLVFIWIMWGGRLPRSIALFAGPSRNRVESRGHFVKGAQLLARSRSVKAPTDLSLAQEAADEAERAISLDPTDAACYILKGLALERQGHMTAALKSLDVALSPRVVKSLAQSEQSDALLKRAEVRLRGEAEGHDVDEAVADLEAAVALNGKNVKALCLLGSCYEKKGESLEAKRMFEEALQVEPLFSEAKAVESLLESN